MDNLNKVACEVRTRSNQVWSFLIVWRRARLARPHGGRAYVVWAEHRSSTSPRPDSFGLAQVKLCRPEQPSIPWSVKHDLPSSNDIASNCELLCTSHLVSHRSGWTRFMANAVIVVCLSKHLLLVGVENVDAVSQGHKKTLRVVVV